MATITTANGASNCASAPDPPVSVPPTPVAGRNNHKFDPNFTAHVIGLMASTTLPRHREILSSLISHLHDFCRDIELTQDEWVLGVNYVNSIGQAYKKNRNEAWRVCDVLGVES